jgi:hypothetical protein
VRRRQRAPRQSMQRAGRRRGSALGMGTSLCARRKASMRANSSGDPFVKPRSRQLMNEGARADTLGHVIQLEIQRAAECSQLGAIHHGKSRSS